MSMTREQYLLTCLAEECAEVAQCASKAIRFGLSPLSGRPEEWRKVNNREDIEAELGDLLGLVDMLGLIPCPDKRKQKPAKVDRYMRLSVDLGTAEG